MDVESLKTELKNNRQDHLLKYWETLNDEQKGLLYNDLKVKYDYVIAYLKIQLPRGLSFCLGRVGTHSPSLRQVAGSPALSPQLARLVGDHPSHLTR